MVSEIESRFIRGWSGGGLAIFFFIARAVLIVAYVTLELRYHALGFAYDSDSYAPGELPWLFATAGTAILMGLAIIAGAVFFFVWLWRSVYNLRKLGAAFISFTPGWAVGWWFIPILNLWKPYEVLRELFHYSSPVTRDAEPPGGAFCNAPPYLLILWIAFLLIAKLPRIWLQFYGAEDFLPGSAEFTAIRLARTLPLVIDSAFYIWVIWAVDRLQNTRHMLLGMQAQK